MTYKHFNNETMRSSVIRAVANTENETAWQRLFDLYAGFIFSIARSKGLKPEDADDIVQIVFTDLARNLPTFQYDRVTPKIAGCFCSGDERTDMSSPIVINNRQSHPERKLLRGLCLQV